MSTTRTTIKHDRFRSRSSLPKTTALATTERLFDGKYEILETIEGPNSDIHKVRDTSGRELAIKVVDIRKHNKDGAIEKKLKMLGNEMQVGRTLQHPNIVEYCEGPFYAEPYEVQLLGEEKTTQCRQLYIIMEHFGESLASLVEGKSGQKVRFTEDQIKEIAKKVLDALSYCHSRNIIHRDISPNNILIKFKDGQIKGVKLADFGAANTPILDTEQSGTMSTASVCTNGFTANEAFVSPQKVSDIYSLGATILYCATNGRHNADSRNYDPGAWDEVVSSAGSLAGLVAKSLSLDQRERYQTATDMRDALSNGCALVIHEKKPSLRFRAAVAYRKWRDPTSLSREQLEYLIQQGLDFGDKKQTPTIIKAAIEKVPIPTLLELTHLPIKELTGKIHLISELEQAVEKAADADEIEAFYYANVERLSKEAKRVLGAALVPKLKDSKKIKDLFFAGLLSIENLEDEVLDPDTSQNVAGAAKVTSTLWEKLTEKDALEIFESDQFADGRERKRPVFLLEEKISTSENALRAVRTGIRAIEIRKKLIYKLTMADIRKLVDEAEELSEDTQDIVLTRVSRARRDRISIDPANPGRTTAFSTSADLAYLLSSGKFTDKRSFRATYAGGLTADDLAVIILSSENLPEFMQVELIGDYIRETKSDEQKAFDLLASRKVTSQQAKNLLCACIHSEDKAFEILYIGNYPSEWEDRLTSYIENNILADKLLDKAQSDISLSHLIERTTNFDKLLSIYDSSKKGSNTRFACVQRLNYGITNVLIPINNPASFLRRLIFVANLGTPEQSEIVEIIKKLNIPESEINELIEEAVLSVTLTPELFNCLADRYKLEVSGSFNYATQKSFQTSLLASTWGNRTSLGKRILLSGRYEKELEQSVANLVIDENAAYEVLSSRDLSITSSIVLASRIVSSELRSSLIAAKPQLASLFST